MKHSTSKVLRQQIEEQKNNLRDEENNFSLDNILSTQACQSIIEQCRAYRERVYTPLKTVIMFIKQMLDPDKSCRNVVASEATEALFNGAAVRSLNTGPYCKARGRLPAGTMQALVVETGQSAVVQSKGCFSWQGREVKLVDGTMLTMADTLANQAAFPQHGNQKEDVGFPLARMVAIMSLGVGTVLNYAIAPNKGKGTGEHALYRAIANTVNSDDILLGDCYYPSFFYRRFSGTRCRWYFSWPSAA